jgi:hypothetical protein
MGAKQKASAGHRPRLDLQAAYGALALAHSQATEFQTRGLPETLSSAVGLALARRAVALDGADAEPPSVLARATEVIE